MKHLLASIGLLACTYANAQQFDFQNTNRWVAKPALHSVQEQFKKESAVTILDDRKVELKEDGKSVYMFNYQHKIIRVQDDKGIEMYNKIYIAMYPGSEIINIKARTITPSQKVIELPSDKIKEIEEDGRRYKLFAMEGVEKGSEVEYTYTIRRDVALFGTEMYQDSRSPIQEGFFTLTVPLFLKYDVKGFNNVDVSKDSVVDKKRIVAAYVSNVPSLDEEKYAYRDKYLKRIEYKLSYNLSKNDDVRLYTWKEFAQKAFMIYTQIDSKEEKAVDKFFKKIDLSKASSEAEKILAIEDFVKTNINVDENLIADGADNIERIVATKQSDDKGIARLTAALLGKAGIKYQIVFVCPRDEMPFDESFENWNRVDDIIIFFPSTGKYIHPESTELRYPYIPPTYAGSIGLYLKGTTIGTYTTALAQFKEIDVEPFEEHKQNLIAHVSFVPTLDTVVVASQQILSGYGANNYRPIFVFLPKDKQEETTKEIIQAASGSKDITNIEVLNSALNDAFTNKPLTIKGVAKSTSLLETAGNRILLKIGEVIGRQEEMYQEKPRQLPVELAYPHVLNRTITFEVPNGYKVQNLNDANITVELKEEGKTTCGFVSQATQKGNTITIEIFETYAKINYSMEQFETFKKVINAAADFNKVVFVLAKQ